MAMTGVARGAHRHPRLTHSIRSESNQSGLSPPNDLRAIQPLGSWTLADDESISLGRMQKICKHSWSFPTESETGSVHNLAKTATLQSAGQKKCKHRDQKNSMQFATPSKYPILSSLCLRLPIASHLFQHISPSQPIFIRRIELIQTT